MLSKLTYHVVNQIPGSGSLLLRRSGRKHLRVLVWRWKRALLLPETILIAGLLIAGGFVTDHAQIRAGQPAMASVNGVVQDGVSSPGAKRKQRGLQDKVRGNPATLMSLNGDDMIAVFNYADLQRHEGDTVLFQFRGSQCVLDVYATAQTTIHYEFRTRQQAGEKPAGKIRPQQCIDDILESRRV